MFAIGDDKWPGVSKLVEELGELQQVLGKLMGSRGNIHHWSGNLNDFLHDEISDVRAAINFVVLHCDLDAQRIELRRFKKLEQFEEWHVQDPESKVTQP